MQDTIFYHWITNFEVGLELNSLANVAKSLMLEFI